jgi:hypothetical protein
MVSIDELEGVISRFSSSVNENQGVQRLIKKWSTSILIWASDLNAGVTMEVVNGKVTRVSRTSDPGVGRVRVVGESRVLMGIFTGKENPAKLYMDGVIQVYGPERDQVVLDAVVNVIWG